eukprot:TRINITY_DN16993_c0_g1_i1.p1 TRINITY_DN16993_c0_g1~~TRINITY_DN16993_c0_g1_i1.p1  ORF type:complete len:381 (-),score=35.30 TRINITY_DN16993_c0_g1_i1:114-1256(-)
MAGEQGTVTNRPVSRPRSSRPRSSVNHRRGSWIVPASGGASPAAPEVGQPESDSEEHDESSLLWQLLDEAQSEWRQGGGDQHRERCLDAFRRFDKNDDGTISFEEFLSGWLKMCPAGKLREARLRLLFNLIDNDANGYIEYHELQELLLGKVVPGETQVAPQLQHLPGQLRVCVDTAEGHEFHGVCSDIMSNLRRRTQGHTPTVTTHPKPHTTPQKDTFLTNLKYLEFSTTRRPALQSSLLPPVPPRASKESTSIWTPAQSPPKTTNIPAFKWSHRAPVPPLEIPRPPQLPRAGRARTHRCLGGKRATPRFAGGKKLNAEYVSVVRELVGGELPCTVLTVDKALEALDGSVRREGMARTRRRGQTARALSFVRTGHSAST